MSCEVHVRFCEGVGVRVPRATRLVVGFQSKADAERFWAELVERLRKFRLELHPEKTHLLEFGPFAAEHRRRVGQGKPETFNFLSRAGPETEGSAGPPFSPLNACLSWPLTAAVSSCLR